MKTKHVTLLLSRFCTLMALPWDAPCERLPVGGQAVIEGVLMKGYQQWGLSVREPDGGLWRRSWSVATWVKRFPWDWPVLRGVAVMADMMKTGYRALNLSAQVALGEEEGGFSLTETVLSLVLAIGAVVGLFLLLPLWISEGLGGRWGWSPHGIHAFEGLVRGGVFVAYLALMGCWGEMRRVFAYHGAEHKTINAFEAGEDLTPEIALRYSRIHRRCGTSFLLVVVAVSILVFGLAGTGGALWRFSSRIVLLPVVVGLSYEIIRWASKDSLLGRWLLAPALLLQYLTTREPSSDQLEVAIDALRVALGDPLPETQNP
ncbi:DUF1385 domain-containing protein [Aminomonas paucivorans]|uniref:DUF1385 domain-containing protein n=1 Tax=Aminomonas paucivorans TaxID=81412 RepID=UPI0033255036